MPTVQQISNQVNRKFIVLERQLKRILLAFYNKYIRGSQAPIELLKQKYGLQLNKIVANAVKDAWLYSHDILKLKLDISDIPMTEKDLQGMLRVAQRMTNEFWITAGKNLRRETEFQFNSKTHKLEEKQEFVTGAAMLGIGSFILYLAFNEGMKSKSDELNQIILLRFTTRRDERVDPSLCKPEEGKIYGITTNLFPPLHRHCRCKLIPVLVE
jgi:hypothetical protein